MNKCKEIFAQNDDFFVSYVITKSTTDAIKIIIIPNMFYKRYTFYIMVVWVPIFENISLLLLKFSYSND